MYLRAAVLVGLLFGVSYCAYGQSMVVRQGSDFIRLQSAPCTDPSVLHYIPEESRKYFKAGYAEVDGKKFSTCWAVRRRGDVLVIYPDGDIANVPMEQFIREVEG
jgi:hypothetical protein